MKQVSIYISKLNHQILTYFNKVYALSNSTIVATLLNKLNKDRKKYNEEAYEEATDKETNKILNENQEIKNMSKTIKFEKDIHTNFNLRDNDKALLNFLKKYYNTTATFLINYIIQKYLKNSYYTRLKATNLAFYLLNNKLEDNPKKYKLSRNTKTKEYIKNLIKQKEKKEDKEREKLWEL